MSEHLLGCPCKTCRAQRAHEEGRCVCSSCMMLGEPRPPCLGRLLDLARKHGELTEEELELERAAEREAQQRPGSVIATMVKLLAKSRAEHRRFEARLAQLGEIE